MNPSRLIARLPPGIRFLISLYVLGIIFFALFRVGLVLTNLPLVRDVPVVIMLEAMFMGFRFDTVISCYILLVPFLGALVIDLAAIRSTSGKKIIFWYSMMLYAAAFFICAVDIPFYNYFTSRLNVTVFEWMSTPGIVASLILSDVQYYPYIILLVAVIVAWIFLGRMVLRKWVAAQSMPWSWRRTAGHSVIYLFAALVLLIGIRGRVATMSPLRWGTAFFSGYPFPNELGLNPVFTLTRSTLDAGSDEFRGVRLMDDEAALRAAQNYLHITPDPRFDSPLARSVTNAPQKKYNVVLVIMESMSADKLEHFGRTPCITPFLDSITDHALLFRNFYSAGIHTRDGIFSTLVGYPALMSQHIMKNTEAMQPFPSIFNLLNNHGYRSLFACTYDEQFDNVGGFVGHIGCENIISQKDFASADIISTWGAADGVLFDHALKSINRMSSSGQPFFSVVLTSTDHGPYALPDPLPTDFHPKTTDRQTRAIEYADWSIRHFMEQARAEPWYDSTIFIFIADHGAPMNSPYDMNISYNHIPLIIYAPKIFPEGKVYDSFGGQIDIMPTVMNLVGASFVNNSLGVDLFTEKRPFMFFSSDDKIGCINEKYFLVLRKEGEPSLYDYRRNSMTNYAREFPSLVDSMSTYARSMIQTAQWMITHRKVMPHHK